MADDERSVRGKFLALAVAGVALAVASGAANPGGVAVGGVVAVGATHRALGERNYWGQTVLVLAALAVAAGAWRLRSGQVDLLGVAYLGVGVASGVRARQYLRHLRQRW